jgi:uncharacterized Ntn-hydrolase superfamily protein
MTYSIVAVDEKTGECGSAVASCSTAVGGTVTFSKTGVGVINTQSHAHITIGTRVLDEMDDGAAPHVALEQVLGDDPDAEKRQFLAIDVKGRRGAWTGRDCAREHFHRFGDGCVAAGNYLVSREVVVKMVEAYEGTRGELLENRLFEALRAGERAGGDSRGQRAAAIIVVPGPDDETDINLDIRVDDHDRPLDELERLQRVFRREFPAQA